MCTVVFWLYCRREDVSFSLVGDIGDFSERRFYLVGILFLLDCFVLVWGFDFVCFYR